MIETEGDLRVTRIVENPARKAVSSTLVGFGRYILPREIIDILSELPGGPHRPPHRPGLGILKDTAGRSRGSGSGSGGEVGEVSGGAFHQAHDD